jgi:predicted ATPase
LCDYLTISKSVWPKDGFFLRAESFYNTASYLEQNSTLARYGGVSFHEQSHGESFLALAMNRFEGNGLYILDEPESALSPQRLMSLLVVINELVKNNSQFIIATHSPILMAYPDADILEFSEQGIHKVGYRETEHYKITKQFIDMPERMVKYLLSD